MVLPSSVVKTVLQDLCLFMTSVVGVKWKRGAWFSRTVDSKCVLCLNPGVAHDTGSRPGPCDQILTTLMKCLLLFCIVYGSAVSAKASMEAGWTGTQVFFNINCKTTNVHTPAWWFMGAGFMLYSWHNIVPFMSWTHRCRHCCLPAMLSPPPWKKTCSELADCLL